MSILNRFARYACNIREFFAPSYRPECHYMRGPGPACARRSSRRAGGDPSYG